MLLTPVSGLVATRTKFMPETASSTTHSLFLGFCLPDISLYDQEQDSLSLAFLVSESIGIDPGGDRGTCPPLP